MALQEFQIKYIPDIFPDIDFTSSIVVDSYYMELPALTTIAKTEERWGTWYDLTKEQRKIQAVRERRLRFEWITKERVEYDNLMLADSLTVITDDLRTIELFNPTLNIEKINDYNNYKVSLEASIKELDQIATYRSSDISEQRGSINKIYFEVKNQVIEVSTDTFYYNYDGTRYYYQLTFDNSYFDYLPFLNDKYYWHTDNSTLNQYNENFEEALIFSQDTIETKINLYFNQNFTPPDITGQQATYVLDSFIEINEVTTSITPLTDYIYFDFEPNRKIILKDNQKISDGNLIEYNSRIQVQELLHFKFYLKEEELFKLKYLYQADTIQVIDGAFTYNVLQVPDSIKQIDRTDLIKLYEFEADFIISNILNTQK